jgi:heterodisulfide reductase subunit D
MGIKLLEHRLIERLTQIVDPERIFYSSEDLYVYSFEKIFEDKKYPAVNAIVRTTSQEEITRIKKLAEKEGFVIISRGDDVDYSKIKNQIAEYGAIILDYYPPPKVSDILEKNIQKAHKRYGESRRAFRKKIREIYFGPYKVTKSIMNLYLLDKLFNNCQTCKVCSGYCTVAPSFNYAETWSSKGRYLLTRGLMKDSLVPTEKIINVIYSCTLCGACYMQCTSGLEMDKAIIAARRNIAERGLSPLPIKEMCKNIEDRGNPFGSPTDIRVTRTRRYIKACVETSENRLRQTFGVQGSEERGRKVLYWVGCNTALRAPEIAEATVNVLSKAGIRLTVLGEKEDCCGSMLVSGGLFDRAKENAKKIIDQIRKSGVQTIVTSCAGCYEAFTNFYSEILGIEMPFEVLHTSQLIERLLKNGRLLFKYLPMKVTYHDPCSLGRHCKVYDAPRNVLKAIPDLELLEMPLNKENSRCCGGGGGFYAINNKASLNSAFIRITQDVLPLGTKAIAIACPQCYTNFRIPARSHGIAIYDIVQIADRALQ